MEHPGFEEDTVHDARVLISRRWEGGGSRFGSVVSGPPGDATEGQQSSQMGTPACNSEYALGSGIQLKCLYRMLGGGDSSRSVVPIQVTPEWSTWACEGRVT
jgi:hypothetical protein